MTVLKLRSLSCRLLLPAALAAGMAAALPPSTAIAEQVILTYASFGGALQKAEEAAWLRPFENSHPGVKIVYDEVDYAKLKVMVESGQVTWDVLATADDFGLKSDEPLLEKLDCHEIPCSDMAGARSPTTGYRVAQTLSGVVLGYNTAKMPKGRTPQGWADMFDLKRFPGKRVVMMDASSYVFEQALLADGVEPKNIYPLDLSRAIRKLNSLGDRLTVAPSYQGCAELVGSGEAVMGGCWSGRFTDVIERTKAPVAICWNQGIVSSGYFSVPRGARHKALAMQFIAWAVSAEHNGAISNFITYGPANPKALAHVPPTLREKMLVGHLDTAFFPDNYWYDANRAEVNRRWTTWVSGME
jgi:putative spermidine/putrescine transport system substrate-binding protein